MFVEPQVQVGLRAVGKLLQQPALAHRLILKPELWASRVSAAQVVQSLLGEVPAPSAAGP
jgi:MoxR-like ATPase